MRQFFCVYNQQFDRDAGLDMGRFSMNHVDEDGTGGTDLIVIATMATAGKQNSGSFNERGGLMPPQYRVPEFGTSTTWQIDTKRQTNPNLGGLCYQVLPVYVTTESGTNRGEFFVHRNLRGVGSLGCTVMDDERLKQVASQLDKLNQLGYRYIPYFAFYS